MSARLKYAGIFLFAFSIALPIPLRLIALMFMVMIVNVLFLRNSTTLREVLSDRLVIVFLAFFLTDVVRAFLFLENPLAAAREVKISFAIIPILFLLKQRELKTITRTIFIFFTMGVVAYIIYAWSFAFYFYTIKYPHYEFSFFDGYAKYLLDYHLPNSTHHVYIGMYIVFVVLVIYYNTFAMKSISFAKGITLSLFFIFNLFYIGSKSMLFLLVVLLIVITFYANTKNFKRKYLYLQLAILVTVAGLGIAFVWSWLPVAVASSIEKRIPIYECATNVAFDNFWLGVGQKYIRWSGTLCPQLGSNELLTHNMYLNELIANGVVGLIILLSLLIILFSKSLRQGNIILASLTLLVSIAGLTEDLLSRQWGVMFFVPAVIVLYICYLKPKDDTILN